MFSFEGIEGIFSIFFDKPSKVGAGVVVVEGITSGTLQGVVEGMPADGVVISSEHVCPL